MNHLKSILAGLLACVAGGASATVLTDAQKPSAQAFESMRHGIFTTVVYNLSIGGDGKRSYKSFDEFANGFDVKAYADSVKEMGVEYVIFTGWHCAMYNLGPNDALKKWLPGHTCKRDLIAEIADALAVRGIKLVIYAHPNDGHDLKPAEKERVGFIKPEKGVKRLMPKFNDFINEVYAETATRAAKHPNVIGFWWDSWGGNGGAIDMPRLRKTLLASMPRAIVLSNGYNGEWIDYPSLECYYIHGPKGDIDNLIAKAANQCTIFAGNWWCGNIHETSLYSPGTLFRFTAFNACTGAPGGMAWSVSPTCDGKTWATNNLDTLKKLGAFIKPVRASLCGVAPSRNWPVPGNSVLSKSAGYGATRAEDGTREYLHVLRPPSGAALEIPEPFERFTDARRFVGGRPVKLEKIGKVFRLTLEKDDHWDPLDTVIELRRDASLDERSIVGTDPAIRYSAHWLEQNSLRYTQTPGETAEFDFTGTKFRWIGTKGTNRGVAEVAVDGGNPVEIDGWAPETQPAVPIYEAELPPGKHTVRITVLQKTHPDARGHCVQIEQLRLLEKR